jgi:two-component system chemotaxis sensor kinase CheA
MNSDLDRDAFLGGYLAEVEEHLVGCERQLLAAEAALQRGEPQPRAVRELYRSLHTIKGLSAMVGVEPVVALAHALEELLRPADRAGGRLPRGAVDVLAQGLRAVEQRVRAFGAREAVPEAPPALLAALAALVGPGASGAGAGLALALPPEIEGKLSAGDRELVNQGLAEGKRLVRIDFTPSPERAARGETITAVRERVAKIGEIVRVIPLNLPRGADAPTGLRFALLVLDGDDDAALAAAAGAAPGAVEIVARPAAPGDAGGDDGELGAPPTDPRRGRVVRVEVSRLDDALERLSALVVTRFRLQRAIADLAGRGADIRALSDIAAETGRQLRDLRGAIMRARMVSVAELLERVPLIVRGLARATGKQVRLEIDAGRAELDKAVGERIFPAVVHLIRNAVDHAIEPAEARRAAGKPAEGVVRVSCHERGAAGLELTVEDDGRGVDREAVARRAGRAAPEDDDALLELLAAPGFSTASQTTTTSGRGMGVDIVRRIVNELGGELRLSTTPGRGTRFALRVPLSLTIVDAFSFVAGGQSFVAPVSHVEEILELADVTRIAATADGGLAVELVERRGEAVPLLRLDALFALPPAAAAKALVVRRGTAPYGFLVERMLGQNEVVVRPVDDPLVKVPGVSGATDLGDGRPTLVLDLVALTATYHRRPAGASDPRRPESERSVTR